MGAAEPKKAQRRSPAFTFNAGGYQLGYQLGYDLDDNFTGSF